jgi:hypothetical protein
MHRVMIRIVLIGVFTVSFIGIFVTVASARRIVQISGTHSRASIEKTCGAVADNAGLSFGTSKSSGGYGCINTNNGNSVNCTPNGHCTGSIARPALDTVSLDNALGTKTQSGVQTPSQ